MVKKLEGFQKGVNLGGWLSQGPLDHAHIESFIKEEDIERIKGMGCDHLRLPVDYENILTEDNKPLEYGLNKIETCIGWCKKYGLNVVLDLHKTKGYIFDDPTGSKDFFYDERLKALFLDIWDMLSARFGKYQDMMMFEMLNEVTDFRYKDLWNELAEKCFKVIRKHASTVKIIYGGVFYSSTSTVKYLLPPFDENVVYNIHCYEPIAFTHQGGYWVEGMPLDFRTEYKATGNDYEEISKKIPSALSEGMVKYGYLLKENGAAFFEAIFKEAVDCADKYNAYLYCGEYGVIDLADAKSTINWLKDIHKAFTNHGIGRAIWNYKEKDFGIIGDHYKDVYQELIENL